MSLLHRMTTRSKQRKRAAAGTTTRFGDTPKDGLQVVLAQLEKDSVNVSEMRLCDVVKLCEKVTGTGPKPTKKGKKRRTWKKAVKELKKGEEREKGEELKLENMEGLQSPPTTPRKRKAGRPRKIAKEMPPKRVVEKEPPVETVERAPLQQVDWDAEKVVANTSMPTTRAAKRKADEKVAAEKAKSNTMAMAAAKKPKTRSKPRSQAEEQPWTVVPGRRLSLMEWEAKKGRMVARAPSAVRKSLPWALASARDREHAALKARLSKESMDVIDGLRTWYDVQGTAKPKTWTVAERRERAKKNAEKKSIFEEQMKHLWKVKVDGVEVEILELMKGGELGELKKDVLTQDSEKYLEMVKLAAMSSDACGLRSLGKCGNSEFKSPETAQDSRQIQVQPSDLDANIEREDSSDAEDQWGPVKWEVKSKALNPSFSDAQNLDRADKRDTPTVVKEEFLTGSQPAVELDLSQIDSGSFQESLSDKLEKEMQRCMYAPYFTCVDPTVRDGHEGVAANDPREELKAKIGEPHSLKNFGSRVGMGQLLKPLYSSCLDSGYKAISSKNFDQEAASLSKREGKLKAIPPKIANKSKTIPSKVAGRTKAVSSYLSVQSKARSSGSGNQFGECSSNIPTRSRAKSANAGAIAPRQAELIRSTVFTRSKLRAPNVGSQLNDGWSLNVQPKSSSSCVPKFADQVSARLSDLAFPQSTGGTGAINNIAGRSNAGKVTGQQVTAETSKVDRELKKATSKIQIGNTVRKGVNLTENASKRRLSVIPKVEEPGPGTEVENHNEENTVPSRANEPFVLHEIMPNYGRSSIWDEICIDFPPPSAQNNLDDELMRPQPLPMAPFLLPIPFLPPIPASDFEVVDLEAFLRTNSEEGLEELMSRNIAVPIPHPGNSVNLKLCLPWLVVSGEYVDWLHRSLGWKSGAIVERVKMESQRNDWENSNV